jgi:chromosome segregation ATPase
MGTKNSQILLIENALQGLNKHIYEKEDSIRMLEDQTAKLKETISSLKYECKTALNEQEKLEDKIEHLEKTNSILKGDIQEKDKQLAVKAKELDTIGIKNEEFLNSVEHKMQEAKKQLEDKNSIILELQRINKELNKEMQNLKEEYENVGYDNSMLKKELKNQRKNISKLEKKLKQEEFKNFIDSKNKFDYSNDDFEDITQEEFDTTLPEPPTHHELQLDKLEGKLKEAKKLQKLSENKDLQDISSQITEEDILRKKFGM